MTSQSSDPSRIVVERRFIYHGPELGHLPRKTESIVVSHSLKVCFQECSCPGDEWGLPALGILIKVIPIPLGY